MLGIGLKTFISSGQKFEKIAEFNKFSNELRKLNKIDLAKRLSALRNDRIDFANRTYNVTNAIYHCVTRNKNKLKNLGIDSVHITKLDTNLFRIDFAKIDSYEDFKKIAL